MVSIIIVSHSPALAKAVVEFVSEMKGDDPFSIVPVAGMEDGSFGSDPMKIAAEIQRLDEGEGVLLLGDIGSSIMNAGMALDFLPEGVTASLADAPLVEGALAAASYNAKGVTLAQLKAEAEAARVIPKL